MPHQPPVPALPPRMNRGHPDQSRHPCLECFHDTRRMGCPATPNNHFDPLDEQFHVAIRIFALTADSQAPFPCSQRQQSEGEISYLWSNQAARWGLCLQSLHGNRFEDALFHRFWTTYPRVRYLDLFPRCHPSLWGIQTQRVSRTAEFFLPLLRPRSLR